MSLNSLMQVNSRSLKKLVLSLFTAGLVPFVRSSPGTGKSAIYRNMAKELNLKFVDVRLSMYSQEDFMGLPTRNGDRSRFLPFEDFLPLESDPIPKGYSGWFISLDEFPHAGPEVMRASYRLILDREVGNHKLHPNCVMALAGNRIEDNALSNPVGTALETRVTHLTLVSDSKVWVEDVAIPQEYDPRIIAYISYNPQHLNDFNPDVEGHSQCTERTWEFVSKLIKGEKDIGELTPLICGTISPGVGTSFIQFCKNYDSMISIEDIKADPENIDIPQSSPMLWAVTTHLASIVEMDSIDAVCTFMDRVPIQYMVIFLTMLRGKKDCYQSDSATKLKLKIAKGLRN